MEAILALDNKNGLSKENKIPWNCKKDLKFFYDTTVNNVVIMGKNTYFSLPERIRPLRNRLNIVLTSQPNLYSEDTSINNNVIFTNYENIYKSILSNREKFMTAYPFLSRNFKIYIIGGKQVYEKFIPLCQSVWVSFIKNDYSCDLFFDYDFKKEFKEVQFGEDDEFKISKYTKK
uniref:dihydrofolate reductase n=1 Tax=viral metagenome TaxID=1070528 RepID=A0A6C0AR73_9ZZZZ